MTATERPDPRRVAEERAVLGGRRPHNADIGMIQQARRPRTAIVKEWISGDAAQKYVKQGIYTVAWHKEGAAIVLSFDYLSHSRSSGDVHAELEIVVDGSTGTGHYQRTRLNLLADRSVMALAKSLGERLPLYKLDWPALLNEAVQWVLTEYRSGEPSVILSQAPAPEGGTDTLLAPLLASEGITILFGDGGASKSYLLLAMLASVASGVDLIPGYTPSRQVNVAFLDWEWSAWKHRQRLERLWQDIDAPIPNIHYLPCRLPIREERDRIRRLVRDEGIGLIGVDSVGLACGGAPEEAEVAIQFFGVMRELGIPAACVAHVNRQDAKGSADKPFGSSYWHNSARNTWYVKRADDADGESVPVGLYHRKDNDGAKLPPVGLQWHFADDRTWIERTSVEDSPELASQLSVPKRIAMLLRGGPMTIHAIAEELDVPGDTVRKALQRGIGKAFVNFPGGGGNPATWALAARDEG